MYISSALLTEQVIARLRRHLPKHLEMSMSCGDILFVDMTDTHLIYYGPAADMDVTVEGIRCVATPEEQERFMLCSVMES